jgi:hypothetical protein
VRQMVFAFFELATLGIMEYRNGSAGTCWGLCLLLTILSHADKSVLVVSGLVFTDSLLPFRLVSGILRWLKAMMGLPESLGL